MNNLTKQPTEPQLKPFYLVSALIWLAGVLWLGVSLFRPEAQVEVCVVKHIYGFPCPSCGTTRAIGALLHGALYDALMWNPLGLPVLLALLVFPFFWLYDVLQKRFVLRQTYAYTEQLLQKPLYALTFFGIMATLWIWNIMKGI